MTPSRVRMVLRGMIRRCPRCGTGHLFRRWLLLAERCPGCGMRFEREEGFWLGGYVINIAAGEGALLILLAWLIADLANHTQPNIALFVLAGVAIAVGGPLVTFPYSRTVWAAIYLIMRPLSPEEVTAAQSAVATAAMSARRPGDR